MDMNRETPATAVRVTNHQLKHALKKFADVTLTKERLRQLREGGKESRRRKNGTLYERPYPAQLQQGVDWDYDQGIVYFLSGLEKMFRKYGVNLTPEVLREMTQHPRNRWEEKRISKIAS